MRDLYEILRIDKSADNRQIKRAYYDMVKQYPPERFPEEFKEIRAAYDVLSVKDKRAEYDEASDMPEDAARRFNNAQLAFKHGQYEYAADIFSKILKKYPALSNVRVEYARSLIALGKTGKAVSVLETLCAMSPGNAMYRSELAKCYDMRGWRKKAIEAYQDALDIDDSDAHIWILLIHSYAKSNDLEEAGATALKAIDAVKKSGEENIHLYNFAIMFAVKFEPAPTKKYLQDIVRLTREGVSSQEEISLLVQSLLKNIMKLESYVFIPYVREIADSLAYMDDDLRAGLTEAERQYEIESLDDKDYDEVFHDLFIILDSGCDCEDCKTNIAGMEHYILSEKEIFRSQLTRLKSEFPRLYALHSGFFNEVLDANARNLQKMQNQRLTILTKHGYQPSPYYDEDDELPVPQPARREETKVGRNDPCPCGSGKKFKKCCGA